MNEFMLRRDSGKFWFAGHTVWGLCSAYNFATKPSLLLTDRDHKRSRIYARAVRHRLEREGWKYKETENGLFWPSRAQEQPNYKKGA